jgi:hypothetical protein
MIYLMKNLFAIFIVLTFSGCATIDRSQYTNVMFDEDGSLIEVKFKQPQPYSQEFDMEYCVREYIKNDPIAIGEDKILSYATGEDKIFSYAKVILGPPSWLLHGQSEKKTIKATELIIKSSQNHVKTAGRIPHSLDSKAPVTLAFLLTVTANSTGTHYIYTDLQRIFHSQNEGYPDVISGWIAMTDKVPKRFYTVYDLLEETVNDIQACIIQNI